MLAQEAQSQVSNENDLHRLILYEGQEQFMVSFFRDIPALSDHDYVYLIMLPPMRCSRCEGLINLFYSYLKAQDQDAPVILMAFYPKARALNTYLEKRSFLADLIITLHDDTFLEKFYCSSKELQVPYFLKFQVHSGRMIFSKSLLGLNLSTELVGDFLEDTIPASSCAVSSEGADMQVSQPSDYPVAKSLRSFYMQDDSLYPISRILYPEFGSSIHDLVFMDELSYSIYYYHFQHDTGFFKQAVFPGEEEELLFISEDVADSLLFLLKRLNLINPMYFSPKIKGDTLIISSSLPKVFFEDSLKENLAYYNEISYLYKNLDTPEKLLLHIEPDTLPEDAIFTLNHVRSLIFDQFLLLPVEKGWPGSGSVMTFSESIHKNPFLSGFYDHAPLFAQYSLNGDFQCYIGCLPGDFREQKLGYSYVLPTADYYANKYYVTDGSSGKVWMYEYPGQKTSAESWQVFLPESFVSDVSYRDAPLKYIQSASAIYSRSIISIKVKDGVLYLLVKDGGKYFLYFLDSDNAEKRILALPESIDGMVLITAGLYRIQGDIRLFGFYGDSLGNRMHELSIMTD